MLFSLLGSLVITGCRCKLLLRILRLLPEFLNGQTLEFLKSRQVLLDYVDLALLAHSDEESLGLILLQNADWRQFVRCAHYEHDLVV